MRFPRLVIACIIFSVFSHPLFADNKKPIRLGLLPYLSPDLLIKRYAPFAEYLSQQMQRPVKIVTAPSFSLYIRRTMQRRYDLYITAPHFAALAEEKFKHKGLARWANYLKGVIVVRAESNIKTVADLKGRVLAAPDKLAIISILAGLYLEKQGVIPNKDIQIRHLPSHNAALLEVLAKRADVAVVASMIYKKMADTQRNRLRVLASTEQVPHGMFLASPSVSDADVKKMKAAILSFPTHPSSQSFFKESEYTNMVSINEEDRTQMKMLLPLLYDLLEERFK